MKSQTPTRKKAGQITMSDFIRYPVWTWSDEEEGTLMPKHISRILPDNHDAVFVACECVLANGKRMRGVLSVRMSNKQVYMISFPNPDGSLFDFPLQPELKGLVTPEQLSNCLQLPIQDIFPIIYSTPYLFSDGQSLTGQIQ